jgi:polyisoprenyl-teichoic acid--peptidoglycan teichoic acid transferase
VLPPTAPPSGEPGGAGVAPPRSPQDRRRRRRRIRRIVTGVVGLLLIVLVGWVALGYLAFRSAVSEANRRLDTKYPGTRRSLATSKGSILSTPTDIVVFGADRTGHSDSIQIIRTDPSRHLVSTLSVPRDLRVEIAGHGIQKINAAYTLGGPRLAASVVAAYTGLPLQHVVVVDFIGFRDLIDAVGGVTVQSPEKILSTSFDGHVYRFAKGSIHLDGKHALAYARVRKNRLNASDSDVSRGGRQQQVLAGLRSQLVSPLSLFRLRSIGSAIGKPLATDLTANELLELGWVEFRGQRSLHCNLGGTPVDAGGASYLSGDPDGNRRVIAEFTGRTAIQPVSRKQVFAPACRTGSG